MYLNVNNPLDFLPHLQVILGLHYPHTGIMVYFLKKVSNKELNTHFYTGIITHGTLKWLLMGVFVTTMPNQFSTGNKGHVAVWALVRTSTYRNEGIRGRTRKRAVSAQSSMCGTE